MPRKTDYPQKFAELISSFDNDEFFLRGQMLQNLTIGEEGGVQIVWAPFEHVCKSARVALVGICPGTTQAEKALFVFRSALSEGVAMEQALRRAKLAASFGGAMRTNLVNMLDHIGLNDHLHVQSCEQLFTTECEQVHFTSALRYPVFVCGKNYNGSPDMIQTAVLRSLIDSAFAEECEVLSGAIFIPLGPKPAGALRYLAAQGIIRFTQIAAALPHPSGANAERIAYFLGRKDRATLSAKTDPAKIDASREALQKAVAKISGA